MKLTTLEISWHGKEPIFSVDFSSHSKTTRLATCGADFNIRVWSVCTIEEGEPKVDFRANLSRHTKAVNVVRFSPQGNLLASGGDDCFVIIWKLNNNSEMESSSQFEGLNSEDAESKESWQVVKMLRGHIEDVYDVAWSPNGSQLISGSVDNSVIIWDTTKGDKLKLLKDHGQYVQGVCWDPCGAYVASYSSDRTCRIYSTSNYRCCYNVNKITVPNSLKSGDVDQNPKQIKLFHDETMPSFFRRLTFSPDGSLLLVPGGRLELKEQAINMTFVFTRASMNKPVMYYPASKKPTIAVRCCPVLFQHRQAIVDTTDKNNEEKNPSTFKLPYRMVIAVASLDSVVLYDTQRTCPFAFFSNMHYASLTDIRWSSDGRMLAVSSRDGYCSLVTFGKGELGVPYHQTPQEVIEKRRPVRETSPNPRNTSTPKRQVSEVPMKEPTKEKDRTISPKMSSLSIKNFVKVQSAKPTASSTAQNSSPNSAAPRRVSFFTLKSAKTIKDPNVTVKPATTSPRVNGPSLNEKDSLEREFPRTTQPQRRRVGFVTLEPSQNSLLLRRERPPVPLEPDIIIIND